MIKMVTLIKRKSGMSMVDFIEYYESHHRLLGERYLKPHASYYVRRFLHPVEVPGHEPQPEPPFDVLMEIWFPDEAARDAAMAAISDPEAASLIAEDEQRLFEPGSLHSFTVEEYESDMEVP